MGRIAVIALDKTGTLTQNSPQVIETVTTSGISETDALRMAAGVESRSEHPLAQAIMAAAGDDVAPAAGVSARAGHGITGQVGESALRLGKPGWIDPGPLADDVVRLQAAGATVVLLERDAEVLAAIAVRDELRPEAAEVVAQLRRMGAEVAMLTGDNRRTAEALAAEAGIDTVHAELLPEDKARLLAELSRGRPVAMVGDGVNDAPALATADIGIAMGAMGTDVAIETADVALMGEDLRHLPQVLTHSRRARRIMVQNIGLSLALIATLIPLAAFGVLGLATVVFIHELAEVLVILNAIRAARIESLPKLSTWVPDSCSLPTAEQPLRVAEFAALFRDSVLGYTRTGATKLVLVVAADAEKTARELAARETECCTFFDFRFTASGSDVVMSVSVPESRTGVLDALTEAVSAARPTHRPIESQPMVVRSIVLFALAALAEIGGAWLVWQGCASIADGCGRAWESLPSASTASSPPCNPTRTSAGFSRHTVASSSPGRCCGVWCSTVSAPTAGTSSARRSAWPESR